MFWLGILASASIGAGLGIWFLTIVDGLRCRLIGIPDARETKIYPSFEKISSWWRLPLERLAFTHPDRWYAWMAVLAGAGIWIATWSVFFLKEGSILSWLWNTTFLSSLFLVALLDARWRVLPVEPMIYGGIFFGLTHVLLGGTVLSMIQGVLVMGIFFGLQSYLSRGRWLGSGDPILAMAIGMSLGWPRAAVAIYATYLAVIPLLIFQLVRVGSFRRVRWPFGPLLAIGAFVSWAEGMRIWDWLMGW